MLEWVPAEVELMTDLSAAGWVEEKLAVWPEGPGFIAAGVIPEAFEAYARILHSAYRKEGSGRRRSTWAELAAERGKVAHPLMQFESLVDGWGPETVPSWDDIVPLEELTEEECTWLTALLRPFTSTAGTCWFCLWDGFGFLPPTDDLEWEMGRWGPRPRVSQAPFAEVRGLWRRPNLTRESKVELDRRQRQFARLPRVRTLWNRERRNPGRSYLLFRGPLEGVNGFRFRLTWQPPNIWWPEDRAWCVASEIDGYDTIVGASRQCIEAVLASPDLEVYLIDPSDRIDGWADTINGRPPRPTPGD